MAMLDDERHLRAHLGRPRRRPPAGRLLADGDRRACARRHPEFLFMAEAYWDLEWALQQQGFDFCYDKRLYDRLVHERRRAGPAPPPGRPRYQTGWCDSSRTTTSHGRPSVFEPRASERAAVATLTQTGARLVHEGQLEGRKVHLPMFLGRFPPEPGDPELESFYESLADARSPIPPSAAASGTCASDPVGRATTAPRTWSPGVGTATRAGWSSSTSATRWPTGHVRTPWDELRGRTSGDSSTRPTGRPSTGRATISATASTCSWRRGTGTSSESSRLA